MEAVSKKRGRPKVLPENMAGIVSLITDFSPRGCGRRSQQNTYYQGIGESALEAGNESEFGWLLGSEGEIAKPGILSELGRMSIVGGDLAAQNAARHICETKPNTKRAIAIIREARLRKTPQPTVEGAESAIVRAMNNYRDTHPHTTLVQLREALNEAYCIVEDMIDEKESQ